MKALTLMGLVVGATVGLSAWAVKPGDSRQAVTEELGPPQGRIQSGDQEILYYERGTVQFKDGKVVNSELISTDQVREQHEAAKQARGVAVQPQDPPPVQQVIYAQQPAQPQVVYVVQPAQPQIVYVSEPQPQVVYYSQPAPVFYATQPYYSVPSCYGNYPFYYGAFSSFSGSYRHGFGAGVSGVTFGHPTHFLSGGLHGVSRGSGNGSFRR
jgi:hypothetical protein